MNIEYIISIIYIYNIEYIISEMGMGIDSS